MTEGQEGPTHAMSYGPAAQCGGTAAAMRPATCLARAAALRGIAGDQKKAPAPGEAGALVVGTCPTTRKGGPDPGTCSRAGGTKVTDWGLQATVSSDHLGVSQSRQKSLKRAGLNAV